MNNHLEESALHTGDRVSSVHMYLVDEQASDKSFNPRIDSKEE